MRLKPTLWHCRGARSFRPLWALEEIGLEYELKLVPFPPRVRAENWLDINPFGTIPAFIDNAEVMTESVGICHYLAEVYAPETLAVRPSEADYGRYLNFMYQADATLTFPQTIVLRYRTFEPDKGLGASGGRLHAVVLLAPEGGGGRIGRSRIRRGGPVHDCRHRLFLCAASSPNR